MKILIIGSSGMLGYQVLKTFSKIKSFKISATYRNKNFLKKINFKKNFRNINFIKHDVSKKKLVISKYNYIINCVGIIKPKIQESNNESILNAININSIFPFYLSKYCSPKAKIFQIATDCVYSGEKGNYYENFPHDPRDIYGKTKSLGEINKNNFYNIRCSIIGKELYFKKSLLEWFVNQKKNASLSGFDNHLWNGLSTKVFSELIAAIIIYKIKIPNIMHLCPRNRVSKYQLLLMFKKYFSRKDLTIKKVKAINLIDRTLSTSYKEINKIIWKRSVYKKILNINEIVKDIN